MTREEFRDYVDFLRSKDEISYNVYSGLIDGIDTLEQQPCEDCISREQAIKQCGFGMTNLLIADCIRRLPPVTPQLKIGRWEKAFDEHSYWYKCSCCGEKMPKNFWGNDYFSSYCPGCGAKMEVKDGNK